MNLFDIYLGPELSEFRDLCMLKIHVNKLVLVFTILNALAEKLRLKLLDIDRAFQTMYHKN